MASYLLGIVLLNCFNLIFAQIPVNPRSQDSSNQYISSPVTSNGHQPHHHHHQQQQAGPLMAALQPLNGLFVSEQADKKVIAIDSGGPSPDTNPNQGAIPDQKTPKKIINNIEKYIIHPSLATKGLRPDVLVSDVPFLIGAKTPLGLITSFLVDPTFAISFLNSLERTYMGIPRPFRYALQPILALFRMPN